MDDFGLKLSYLRGRKGVSQQEVATGVGVTVSSISKWEKGHNKPDYVSILMLAKFFDVSIDFLMREEYTIYGREDEE